MSESVAGSDRIVKNKTGSDGQEFGGCLASGQGQTLLAASQRGWMGTANVRRPPRLPEPWHTALISLLEQLPARRNEGIIILALEIALPRVAAAPVRWRTSVKAWLNSNKAWRRGLDLGLEMG